MYLRWCDECHKDYPERLWQTDGIHYGDGVHGYLCPKGHGLIICDPGLHRWKREDEIMEVCERCGASKINPTHNASR